MSSNSDKKEEKKRAQDEQKICVSEQCKERQKVLDSLRLTEMNLNYIINNTKDIIFRTDMKGHFTFANSAAAELTGLPLDRIIGANMMAFILPEYRGIIGERFRKKLQGIDVGSFDFDIFGKDGKTVTVSITTELIHDNEGRIIGTQGIARDVTEQKIAQDELKKTLARLDLQVMKRTAQLEESNRLLINEVKNKEKLELELRKRNDELAQFSRSVSHRLKNELMIFSKISELQSKDPSRDKVFQDFSNYLNNIMRFIDELLELAKAGNTISKKIEVPIDSLAREIFRMLKPPDLNAEIQVRPIPLVFCDVTGMETVLRNLIQNSFQYRDPAKDKISIRLSYKLHESHIDLIYKDNGIGIEQERLEKIFETFHTSDTAKHYGLGLPIVRRIIRAHGGEITAESAGKGQGSKFILTLPFE